MRKKTAVTKIDSKANIQYVSKPFETYLSLILPNNIGQNLLEFNNQETKSILSNYIDLVFSSDSPIEEILELYEFKVRISGHCFDGEYAIIYWNDITEKAILNENTTPLFSATKYHEISLNRFTNNLPLAVFEIKLFRDGSFEFGFVNEEMNTFFPEFEREAVNANNSLLFSRVHPEDKEKLIESIRNVFKNNIWDIEYRIIDRGMTRWIKGYGRPEKDISSNQNFITVCTYLDDITASKIISEQLKLVNFTFRNAATPMSFIKKDGTFYDFNDATCSLLGFTREEYFNLTILDINPFLNLNSWNNRWNDIKEGKNVTIITKHRKKDGTLIDVEIKANIIQYGDLEINCAFYTDITEKKKIEERLGLVNFVFEKTNIAIIIANKDSTFYDLNEAALIMHGYTREEMLDFKVGNLVIGYEEKNWDDAYSQVWNYLKANKSFETITQHKRKDGSIIDVEIRANYIKYGDLELNCSFITDISEKKKLEEQLKLVDYSFRNAATTIQLINKDGSFYDFNDAAHNLIGYSREEYQKLSIPEFAVDYNKDYWPIHWNELKKVGTLTFESVLRKKDKSLINVEIRANYINYGNLELNYAFVTDITDKKRIEEALKKSNERYEFATLATSDVIWETDLENNTLFLSNNFTLVFGHKVNGIQPLENNIWRQNVHSDDLIRIQQSEAEIIKSGQDRWQGEYRLKKSDGTYAQIFDRSFAIKNEEGKVVRLIGAMEDITLKRQEEEKLKLFETVILNTTEAIIIRETKKSNKSILPIVYVNDAFTKMTGYHLNEIKGKSLNFLSGPLTQKDEQAKLKDAINNFQSGSMEVINYKKNGETFWASISTFPVANNKGVYTHWVSIQRDITVKKEAEKEREKLLGELLINNKELRQFSYITTHNLRAPLTNLVSICRLLKTESIQDSLTLQLIDAFKTSTTHLNDTLNDLINILIIKENPNISVGQQSLKLVFDKVIQSISNTVFTKKATIDADFSHAETVSFNKAYLESIFLNLLTNSFKYAHPDRNPFIKIDTKKTKEGTIKLIYSDNGIGMNMEQVKDRIFGLYQRFHSNTDSKGIGLYLIHSQITALGGTIEVESEVNVGTIFIITFRVRQ